MNDDKNRNRFWSNTTSKYGFCAVKLVDGLSESEAFEIEKQYVKRYGIRVNGGQLVNLTEGGSGGNTINNSNRDSFLRKCSENKIGVLNPNYGKKTWSFGKVLSEETKRKISDARKGTKIPEKAKEAVLKGLEKAKAKSIESRSIPIKCLITGKEWKSKIECSKELGINKRTVTLRILKEKPVKGYHLTSLK